MPIIIQAANLSAHYSFLSVFNTTTEEKPSQYWVELDTVDTDIYHQVEQTNKYLFNIIGNLWAMGADDAKIWKACMHPFLIIEFFNCCRMALGIYWKQNFSSLSACQHVYTSRKKTTKFPFVSTKVKNILSGTSAWGDLQESHYVISSLYL